MSRADRLARAAERKAQAARMETARAEMRAHVARGTCPLCRARLRRNTSMAGWWQCGRFGSEMFREPEYRGDPPCSFQGFTE